VGGSALEGGNGIADDVLDLLREYAAEGTPCALATVVRVEAPTSARPGDKAVITADGRLRGWVGGSCSEPIVRREALRALAEGTPQLVRIVGGDEVNETRKKGELTLATTCPSGGSLDIFIEPRLPRPLLLVFGDSPAARTLVQMGSLAGFRTRAIGEAEIATLQIPPGEAYAVVATMGHFDEDALEAALSHPDLDVGLIASKRRATAVRAALRARGLDEAMLDRLRTPVGQTWGENQEEIAVLALAEVVAARHSRVRKPAVEQPAVIFATDPVCGMTVDPLTATRKLLHEGRTYWFCSDGCQSAFAADPTRYLKSVEA
jgi:xanthine dehydrogenase accessory factor